MDDVKKNKSETDAAASPSALVKIKKILPPEGISGVLRRRVTVGGVYECDADTAALACRHGEFEPDSQADRGAVEAASKRLAERIAAEERDRKKLADAEVGRARKEI